MAMTTEEQAIYDKAIGDAALAIAEKEKVITNRDEILAEKKSAADTNNELIQSMGLTDEDVKGKSKAEVLSLVQAQRAKLAQSSTDTSESMKILNDRIAALTDELTEVKNTVKTTAETSATDKAASIYATKKADITAALAASGVTGESLKDATALALQHSEGETIADYGTHVKTFLSTRSYFISVDAREGTDDTGAGGVTSAEVKQQIDGLKATRKQGRRVSRADLKAAQANYH